MKRIWLSIAMLTLFLGGVARQSPQALGQTENPCPGADMACDGHAECPNLEEMRAYGECPWYFDNYCHGALADVAVDAPAEDEADCSADCWYDCETDEYYQYEFSHVAAEAVASPDVADSTTCDASAWDTKTCVDEFYADEDYDYGYDWREDCVTVIESTPQETETALPATASPLAEASDEYDYSYDEYPYGYDYDHDYEAHDGMTVQAWQDTDVGSVEDDDAVPPAPVSDLAQFDSEVLLTLARTLNQIGSTLQSLSYYLTEIATADMVQRQHNMLRR
jgi:hypothetical protein